MFGDLKRTRIITFSAAFIGLITLGSWISIPFVPVPLTFQTLFVLLAGIVMKRLAVIPLSAYVLLGAIGLPVFHNGITGIGILLGPTGGYLIGFIFAALVTGLTYEHSSAYVRICGLSAATIIVYLFGIGWLMISTGLGFVPSLLTGAVPFIPGDAIKAGAAYYIGKQLS